MAVAAPFLLTYLAHSTLLAGLAGLGARWVTDPARRELLWRGALFGGLFTAALQTGASDWTLDATRVSPAVWIADVASESQEESEPVALLAIQSAPSGEAENTELAGSRLDVPQDEQTSPAREPRLASGTDWIAGLWLVGALVGLVALLVEHRRLRARLAPRDAMHGDEKALLEKLLGARRASEIRLTSSRALTSPIALSKREICLPASGWQTLDALQREGMLAHEVAHVLRRDPLWFVLAQIVERVFFLQPLNLYLRRKLQSEAEYLCDDWAVRRTGEPLALARCLAAVAEWSEDPTRTIKLAPGMAAQPSTLVQRVERLLDRDTSPRTSRASNAVFAGSLAVCLAAFACSAPGIGTPHEEDSHETRIAAEIRKTSETDLRVEVQESGTARLRRADGKVDFGSFDMTSSEERKAMQAALAEQAAKMPRGGPRAPGRAPSPLDATLASGRLTILLEEGTKATQLQRTLAMCASFDVQIWNIELVSSDGRMTYRVPLPTSADIEPEEEILEGEMIEEAEIAFADPEPRKGVLEVQLRPAKSIRKDPALNGGNSSSVVTDVRLKLNADEYDYPADHNLTETRRTERTDVLEQAAEALRLLHKHDPSPIVSIDVRAGIVYGEVVAILDSIIAAGFTNIVFVGSYE